MAAPQLISSSPAHGSTDVEVNRTIQLTFAEPLLASTVVDTSFAVTDIASRERIDVSVSLSPNNAAIVVLTPIRHFYENSVVRVLILGTLDAVTTHLKSADNTSLVNSIAVEFQVGDNVYQIDETLQKEAQSITLEGDLFLPTNVKALGFDFTLEKVTPANHSHDVPTSLAGSNDIRFEFSQPLLTGQDYTTWVQVQAFPLLDDPTYLGSGTDLNLDLTMSVPDWTASVSGDVLSITFDAAVPHNVGIRVELTDNIESAEGSFYGGNLAYAITTKLFPYNLGVEAVRRELGVGSQGLHSDYLAALIFKCTVEFWENSARKFDLENLSWPAKSYILYSAALAAIADSDYAKFLQAGTRNAWGDRHIQIDNFIGRVSLKQAELQRKLQLALDTVYSGWGFQTAVKNAAYSLCRTHVSKSSIGLSSIYDSSESKYWCWWVSSENAWPRDWGGLDL